MFYDVKIACYHHAKFELYLYSLSSIENVVFDVLINQNFWTSQSLNLLLQSCSRLIFTSEECLKSRFCQENGEKLSLEL